MEAFNIVTEHFSTIANIVKKEGKVSTIKAVRDTFDIAGNISPFGARLDLRSSMGIVNFAILLEKNNNALIDFPRLPEDPCLTLGELLRRKLQPYEK